tara:strand:- start:1857 stop:2054 length:198 start_codon:yes stop_codon:yes gene_type:complete
MIIPNPFFKKKKIKVVNHSKKVKHIYNWRNYDSAETKCGLWVRINPDMKRSVEAKLPLCKNCQKA